MATAFSAFLHLDLDCFYCQVEHIRLGIDRDTPLAVVQWQSLIAVNYAARAAGISRSDNKADALKKCPNIKLIHTAVMDCRNPTDGGRYFDNMDEIDRKYAKANLDAYRNASRSIFNNFKKTISDLTSLYCPVEKASVDEVYIDISQLVEKEFNDENACLTLDEFHKLDVRLAEETSKYISDANVQAFKKENLENPEMDDYDKILYFASRVAKRLKADLHNNLGYSCSIGVAHSKTLAKIGSSLNKPSQITVIRERARMDFLKTYPLVKIPSLGGKMGNLIEEELNKANCTVNDILHWSVKDFESRLKLDSASSEHLYLLVRGQAASKVDPNVLPKSFAAVKQFLGPVHDLTLLKQWLLALSHELKNRWKEFTLLDPKIVPFAKTITVSITKSHETSVTKAFPITPTLLSTGDFSTFIQSQIDLKNFIPCISLSLSISNFIFSKYQANTLDVLWSKTKGKKNLIQHELPSSKAVIDESVIDVDNQPKKRMKIDKWFKPKKKDDEQETIILIDSD